MDAPITNGTPHSSEDNDNSNPDANSKLKVTKQTSSFTEMRNGFLEEINLFLSSGNLDRVKQKWNSYTAKEVTKRVSMEQALKDKIVSILSSPNKDTHVEDLMKFLDSVLVLCSNEHITVLTFVNILSDIVDTSTISVCEKLFDFVEANISVWKSSTYFASGKNNILRMCNDLLRRLSKAQNTVFCGRILLFLAMFFPFSERSGLNIVSDFNSDVIYKNEDEDSGIEEPVEIVDVSLKLDEDFHSKFWLIQDYFHNPNICFNKDSQGTFTQWKEFTEITDRILALFKKHKLNRDAADRFSNKYKSDFFTKFLTSQKLLLLQLSDSNFRRTIFLQMLLLFQYITGQIKTKPENSELPENELEWVKETTEKIYSLIKETPPDGEQFLIITKNMVQREEDWSSWKNEGCPALKKVMPEVSRQSTIEDSLGQRSFSVLSAHAATGFDTLFVPSKTGPPLAMSLKHSFDDYISSLTPAPELKDFLADAIDESERKMDPEKKKVADPSFAWLSVKLISLKAPTFFSNSHTAVPSMSEYVDIMCKKLYRDLNPGLLLPPYMPAPKSVAAKTKKPTSKSTNGSSGTQRPPLKKAKTEGGEKPVMKVVKGGVVKLVKTVQGVKVAKDGENDSSQTVPVSSTEKSKTEEKKDDSKASEKAKTNSTSAVSKSSSASEKTSTVKKTEKVTEGGFAKPMAVGKVEKHKTEKVSKSPSPKSKLEEKVRKEERRGKVEKRTQDRSVERKGKVVTKSSPGKRKASPKRDPHKSKILRVEEIKPKDQITRDQIHDLAKSIASNWKKVADRLGYKDDEILFFETEASSDYNRALNLLLVWVSDEEDATKETLRRHLKALGLTNAASILSR